MVGQFDWESYDNIYDTYRSGNPQMWGLTQIKKKGLRDFGAALSAGSAHHISIGSETLALRMERQCQNATALAEYLEGHDRVGKVFFPGLKSHPEHERSNELFRYPGAILSFELDHSVDLWDYVDRLNVVIKPTNLGDNRTLAIPVAHTIYFEMGPERRASMDIDDSLIRISVGIEDVDDLIEDFDQAFPT